MDKLLNANAVLSVFCKNYTALKKELPIRPSEMGVLNIITGTPGPHTPMMLKTMLGVSKPMITAHITSLEKKEYIIKEISAADKRAYYVLPTDKAKSLAKKTKRELDKHLEALVEGMGEGNFNTFIKLAELANDIFDREEV